MFIYPEKTLPTPTFRDVTLLEIAMSVAVLVSDASSRNSPGGKKEEYAIASICLYELLSEGNGEE